MSLESFLWAIVCSISILACVLFLIFGQITVRKLRKNPEVRDSLGLEFFSGWDIFNAAMVLALPLKYGRWRKRAAFGMLHADADLLYKHTTRFDRILARIFFVPWVLTGLFVVVLLFFYFKIGY